jgi:hypothetical protein
MRRQELIEIPKSKMIFNVFHLVGFDNTGHVALRPKVKRLALVGRAKLSRQGFTPAS